MAVGVSIDSPTPINILGRSNIQKPLAIPVAAVNNDQRATPNAINLGLCTRSAIAPMITPITE